MHATFRLNQNIAELAPQTWEHTFGIAGRLWHRGSIWRSPASVLVETFSKGYRFPTTLCASRVAIRYSMLRLFPQSSLSIALQADALLPRVCFPSLTAGIDRLLSMWRQLSDESSCSSAAGKLLTAGGFFFESTFVFQQNRCENAGIVCFSAGRCPLVIMLTRTAHNDFARYWMQFPMSTASQKRKLTLIHQHNTQAITDSPTQRSSRCCSRGANAMLVPIAHDPTRYGHVSIDERLATTFDARGTGFCCQAHYEGGSEHTVCNRISVPRFCSLSSKSVSIDDDLCARASILISIYPPLLKKKLSCKPSVWIQHIHNMLKVISWTSRYEGMIYGRIVRQSVW